MSEDQQKNFEVKRTQKFGWCQDDIHAGCRVRFSFYNFDYQCACDCHDKKSLPPLEPGKNMLPVKPEKDRAPQQRRKK